MSSLSRKEFLRLSSWTIIGSLLPFQEISALENLLHAPKILPANFLQAVEKAKTAKIHFYKKEYESAKLLYLECISLAPNSVRFYDNLDNIYGAQGNFLESVLLFKNGLLLNPKNVAFYDRAARSLMRLELGYNSLATVYRNSISSSSLLQDAKNLFDIAISIDATKKYLVIGRDKAVAKINANALNINYRDNALQKSLRKARSTAEKQRFLALSAQELREDIENCKAKKRTPLYFKHHLEVRDVNLIKYKKKALNRIFDLSSESEKLKISYSLFELDPSDPATIKRLRSQLYYNKLHKEYIGYKLQFAEITKNIYAYLGALDAIQVAFNKGAIFSKDLALADDIVNNLLEWGLSDNQAISVVVKYNKILALNNDIDSAKTYTEHVITNINKASNLKINEILLSYASLFYLSGDYEKCKNIILIALGENNESLPSDYDLALQLATKKTVESFSMKKPLYHLLFTTYKKLNAQQDASNIITHLRTNDPSDSFLLNRN